MEELRAVIAAADVVLARPHRLDRNARHLGDVNRLGNEVGGGIRAPAEPAAQELRVDEDVLRRDAGDFRCDHLVHGLELRAGPDLAAFAFELHGGVERLHRRVGQVGHVVLGEQLFALRERGIRVALFHDDGAFGLRLLAVIGEKLRRV